MKLLIGRLEMCRSGLGPLNWANISNIPLTPSLKLKAEAQLRVEVDKHEKIIWRCLEECLWRNHNEEYANWPILEFQMKKRSPKSKSTQKTEQDKLFRKFWLLVKDQRKIQSQRWSKSTNSYQSQQSVNSYMVRVSSRSSYQSGCRNGDVILMTWHWPKLGLMWPMLAWR